MSSILVQLCKAQFPEAEVVVDGSPGIWFDVPDNIAFINKRNYQSRHPAFVRNFASLKYNSVIFWIRSTSQIGEAPFYAEHREHRHGTNGSCRLNKVGWVRLNKPAPVAQTHLKHIPKICDERDSDWLEYFDVLRAEVDRRLSR